MIVHADLRWPTKTGIGMVQSAVTRRAPPGFEISDLAVTARIGSPLSPVSLAQALSGREAKQGVFWSPGFIPPAWSAIPTVVTVHDLTHLHYYTRFHAMYYNAIMKPLYHKCRAIICVSEFTRNEFLNWSRMSSERVFTVHNAVSIESFSEGSCRGLTFPYVLYPGNRRSYKNLKRLIQAFFLSSLPRDGVHLLLTGDPDQRLRGIAADCGGIQDRLQFSGSVGDEELAQIYRGARLVAFVSLYEGFGLPILEAMAASVPVLTSSVSAMPEIAGDAALIVDPTSVEEIARGLERLHYDEEVRRRLMRLGYMNAMRFSWDATAAATWEIVRRAHN